MVKQRLAHKKFLDTQSQLLAGHIHGPQAVSPVHLPLHLFCKHHIAAVKERRLTTPLEEARRLGESECSEELMLAMELREAIYALSDEERSIVLLSIIGGYKSHEIAKALSCPPGTVRSKLSRSLAKLRLTAEKESS